MLRLFFNYNRRLLGDLCRLALRTLTCYFETTTARGLWPIPAKGWAEMIRKVYEVNPLTCPRCQGEMRIIAFLTASAVVDRIINHLKLTFVASNAGSKNEPWSLSQRARLSP